MTRLLTVRSGRVHLEGCTRIRTDDAWLWRPANDGPGVATPCPHCLPDGLPTPARTTPAEAIAEYTAGVQRARDAKEDDAIHADGRCVQCGKSVGATRLCGPCRGIKKRQTKKPLPIHRTEAGYPNCSTCDGGGCPDCTDPA